MNQSQGAAPTTSRRAMSVRTVAQTIDAGESTVWKLIKQKRLRAVKMGRSTRVLPEALDAFIAGLPSIGEAA